MAAPQRDAEAPSPDAAVGKKRWPDMSYVRAAKKIGKKKTRCKEGCILCAIKSSSRFHLWERSLPSPLIEQLPAKSPDSKYICNNCLRASREDRAWKLSNKVLSQQYTAMKGETFSCFMLDYMKLF